MVLSLIVIGIALIWTHNAVLLTRIVRVSKGWRPDMFVAPEESVPDDEYGISSLYTDVDSGFVYEGTFRDPFSPSGRYAADDFEGRRDALRLKGVLWSPARPLAVVEDATGTTFRVEEGDVMGEARIVSILIDGIIVAKDGAQESLMVREQ